MKRNFLTGVLIASIFGLSLMGCPQSQGGGNNPDKPTPPTPPAPAAKGLIAKVAVESGNGYREVPYSGAQINTKGKVTMAVFLKDGLDGDGVELDAKLQGINVAFGQFNEQGNGGVRSICEEVQGITTTDKEMVITVTQGSVSETFKFMVKELDETVLPIINVESLMIGKTNVIDKVIEGIQSWRFSGESGEVEFNITVDKELTQAIMVVNGKETILQPTKEDKKVIKHVLILEKDITKTILFNFQADSCKDLQLNPFSLTYTNKVNAVISVDATGRGQGKELTDAEVMSGKVEFNKCTTTEPKITVKVFKARDSKLTKVTANDTNVEIKTEKPGENEEYIATYTLTPALQKTGERKTVKLHIEGTNKDGSKPNDDIDLNVTFVLVQFIEAQVQVQAEGKPFVALQNGHRLYSPNVKLKLISKDVELKDVLVQDYKDADGKTPEFTITDREAIASLKLKDTGMENTTFKIVLSAEGRTDTTMIISLRYSAQDDPLAFYSHRFEYGDIEKKPDAEGAVVMTSDEAKLYVLLGRNVKELTSIKVNGVEVMNKPFADPDKIVKETRFTSEQGMGGKNNNAIFVFGGDKMKQDHVYTLNISMAGVDETGRTLSENNLPTLKIKQPKFDKTSTEWRSPEGSDSQKMEFIEIGKKYHPIDTAQLFYNYYSIQSYTFAVKTKNPKAKVKGIWYRHDTNATERDKILADNQEENGQYASHFLQFTEQPTNLGKSKWCTTLNFEDPDKKDYGISVYLWVISEDGNHSTKGQACDNTVKTPWEQNFRRLDVMCNYTKLANEVGWNNGWDKSMLVVDKAEIDYSKIKEDKLYFRATTFEWQTGRMEYHLFNNDAKPPISEFICVNDPDNYRHDNRFTVDVSSLKDAALNTEMEVSIPLYMKSLEPGKDFTANVFTRKFKIVKKS